MSPEAIVRLLAYGSVVVDESGEVVEDRPGCPNNDDGPHCSCVEEEFEHCCYCDN